MSRRLPSTAPSLPGFTYVRALGSGGFADVFLFEQNLPRRPVAVKVLLAGVVTDEVRQLFRAEANVMAQLGSHPSILTVFQSSVSADGRPYLVMEYCTANLSQRYRSEQLAVPDVLRIGIKIAGAVESAHRTGVLHRDIKPSNILITAYGHPVLSDFGIAATLADATGDSACAAGESGAAGVGMSIPWSAPEVLRGEVSGSIATEVWALGATLYSLLAGRSPFEVPGGDNESAALMARISRARVPRIDRADVPARLDEILARAMHRRSDHRQLSVLELIRELQSVEAELGLAQTPLEVSVDDWAAAIPADANDHTRITGTALSARAPGRRRESRSGAPATRTRDSTRGRTDHSRRTPGNNRSQTSLTGRRSGIHDGRRRRTTIAVLVAALVLVVGIAGVAVTLLVGNESTGIPRVSDVSGASEGGTIVFRWTDPGVESSDNYVVQLRSGEKSIQRGTEFGVDPGGSGAVCVTVTVNRSGASGQPSAEKCVDPVVNR
ncbi:serine/threonine protein kinase [Cryobacterium roopkundense]|uniref:non-specific serine/threonine protein kinase n=1 Tax=Cryobacterium roopkundense TaxID=1001240 RepID=A0A099JFV7_9MICO|nr:serine/threonine-protein kinase [Cryobacterium roopkundense]KGJ76920.1 serine/threonine protein kinase [Cryobacterium roopkundense]MBB5640217.1 serine/threonine protein kinase [Cryobacterium roopkundense]